MGVKTVVDQEEKEEMNNSLADLEAAWEEVESREPEEETSAEEAVDETVAEQPASEGEGDAEGEGESGEGEGEPAASKAAGDAPEAAPEPELRAPAGWTPEAREEWKNLPDKVRSQVLKRERDFAMGIQYTREAAQRAMQYDDLLKPYQPMFAANGQDTANGLKQVLNAAAGLQMGSQAQKVKVVADLINQYGVDLPSLDNYLAEGTVPQGAQQSDEMQRMLQQQLAPLQQMYQQYQTYQQTASQRAAQEAGQTIQQFAQDPAHEFYDDVKMDMADLLDFAAARNQSLSLKDAYDRACMMNPQISQVIQTRQQANRLDGKRRASTSVRGAPSAPSPQKAPDTVRAAIEQAWDEYDTAS